MTEAAELSDDNDVQFVFTLSHASPSIPSVTAQINTTPTKLLVDTGATVNIIDYSSFTKLTPRPLLNPTSPMIYAYGSQSALPIVGNLTAEITYNDERVLSRFHVVKTDGQSVISNLMSGETAQQLGIIHFALSSSPATAISKQYPQLFDGGIGKISDVKIKLHVDPTVQPVAQKRRRIPFHIRRDVERLERLDIIEKVEGPTRWTSETVVAPKSDGGVRICVDMREPNQAIKRTKHPMPMSWITSTPADTQRSWSTQSRWVLLPYTCRKDTSSATPAVP